MAITAPQLRLMQLVNRLTNRSLAKALGVTHPTIARWRNGEPVPETAARLIDHLHGDGSIDSAAQHAIRTIRQRWIDLVHSLTRIQLTEIAFGAACIRYEQDEFRCQTYTSDAPNIVYVGDVSGVCDCASDWAHQILDALGCSEFDFYAAETPEERAICSLAAEAERSQMYRYDIARVMLDALIEVIEAEVDEREMS